MQSFKTPYDFLLDFFKFLLRDFDHWFKSND